MNTRNSSSVPTQLSRPRSERRSSWRLRTCRGEATTGEPSSHTRSHVTSAVPSCQGTYLKVSRSGLKTKSILPASTSERRASRSRRPWTCVESKIRLLSFDLLLAALLPQLGFGPFDRLELLLRRLGDEVVSAVEGEVGDHDSVDDRRPDQDSGVDEETGDHRSDAEHQGHARGEDAARRLVGTLEFRLRVAQDDVREHHQDVRD